MQFLHTDPVCTSCFDIYCLNHKAKFYTACHTVWDQAGFSGEYFFKAGYATSYHPVLPWFQALHTAQCTLWYRFPAFCKYSGSACLPAGLTQRLPSTVACSCSLSVLTLCLAGALAGASPERAQLWPWQVSLSSGCSTPPASQSWPRVKHLPIRSAGSPDPTLTYFPGVREKTTAPVAN